MHQSEPPPPPPLKMVSQKSPPLSAPALQMEITNEPQQVSLQKPPSPLPPESSLPLPAGMQKPPSPTLPLPPPPGRLGAATAGPVLASTNPTQISGPVQWSTGLCGCYNDLPNCFLTLCCPCVTFGEISEIVDKGSSSCVMNGLIYGFLVALLGCACMYSCTYRDRMRRQFNLQGSCCGDCCVHLWCELCALCQEYRELKSRGFDLSKGWDANLELQIQGAMAAPTTQTGMRR